MIQFHEDEYLESAVDDGVLLLVLLLLGQEAKDKLLYGAEDHAGTNRMGTAELGGAAEGFLHCHFSPDLAGQNRVHADERTRAEASGS